MYGIPRSAQTRWDVSVWLGGFSLGFASRAQEIQRIRYSIFYASGGKYEYVYKQFVWHLAKRLDRRMNATVEAPAGVAMVVDGDVATTADCLRPSYRFGKATAAVRGQLQRAMYYFATRRAFKDHRSFAISVDAWRVRRRAVLIGAIAWYLNNAAWLAPQVAIFQ